VMAQADAALQAEPGPVVLNARRIARRVREHAASLAADHPGGDLTLVALLPAGGAFAASLSRELHVPHVLDAIQISRFDPRPGARARIVRRPRQPLAGRHVVVVDAVVDTGLTLHFALRKLAAEQPASLEACVLVDRRAHRLIDDLPLRAGGFPLREARLAGFGLGPDDALRALQDVHRVD
jgi:hypoxanthine phosphoribosyltransferase